MRFSFSGPTRNDSAGMTRLALLETQTRNLFFGTVILDFQDSTFFEANLSAALGAICYQVSENMNELKFENVSAPLQSILEKNQFMSFHGGKAKTDYNSTTVPFRRFRPLEIKSFDSYLQEHLLSMTALPKMSDQLRQAVRKVIIEIFTNAELHGQCDLIYTCGQFYPNKGRVDFTVANLGTTVRKNVRDYLEVRDMTSADALNWAVQEGNTTRRGPIPGGFGLYLLRRLIKLNKGQVHIYSANGYWNQRQNGDETCADTEAFLKGTIVTVEFNVNDSVNYKLSTE